MKLYNLLDLKCSQELAEESASEAYEMHTALLSKGFALERPPSVHQVCFPNQDCSSGLLSSSRLESWTLFDLETFHAKYLMYG